MINSRGKILNQFLIFKTRLLRSFRRESSASARAALEKHRRCKNNDSTFTYIFAKAIKKQEGVTKRSLYNYILLRYNN